MQNPTPLAPHSPVPRVSTWFRRSWSTPHFRFLSCSRTTSPPALVGALLYSRIRFASCLRKTSGPLCFGGSCSRSRPIPSRDSRCGEWCYPSDFSAASAFVHALKAALVAKTSLTLLHVSSGEELHWTDFPGEASRGVGARLGTSLGLPSNAPHHPGHSWRSFSPGIIEPFFPLIRAGTTRG